MNCAALALLLLWLTTSTISAPAVVVTPGIMLEPPSGFYAYNFSPTLSSADNSEIYDPNFIPGFRVGLTNLSLSFKAGPGYADIGYSVGPWRSLEVSIPHMAVGPQCCNFVEVPRTQQFRAQDWGDFYYVKAGFSSPAVNVANYTANFTAPAYVGLRTDWQWVVSFSLDWKSPTLLDPGNEWSTVGLAVTQYVPSAPKKLVYSVIDFWMDPNSTSILGKLPRSANNGLIVGPNEVVYPATQLSNTDNGNLTITIPLSPYLQDTLDTLGFADGAGSPVISYVYLNIEGYNMVWNTRLYSFLVMSNHAPSEPETAAPQVLIYAVPVICGLAGAFFLYRRMKKGSRVVDSL